MPEKPASSIPPSGRAQIPFSRRHQHAAPGQMAWLHLFLRRLLAPKDIYARAQGRMHSFSLSSTGQASLAVIGAAAFGWLVYTSSVLTHYKLEAEALTAQALEMEARYETALAEIQAEQELLAARLHVAQARFADITGEMEAQHDYLISILGKSSRLGQALDARRQGHKERLPDEIRRSKKPKPPAGADDQSNILLPLDEDIHGLNHGILASRPPDLTSGAFRREWRANEKTGFSSKGAALHMHGVLAGTGNAAIDAVIARLERIDEEQHMAAHHIGEILQTRLRDYEAAVNRIGVFDATRLIERIERAGAGQPAGALAQGAGALAQGAGALAQGGPFVPLHSPGEAPVAVPPPPAQKTGGRMAATLTGKVVEAGNSINFGNMIELDHGHGIITRYGHLSEVLVSKGAIVNQDQKIGIIGNSGRSTGEHLHYEILIDDEEYDPWKFVEAGKHVLNIKN